MPRLRWAFSQRPLTWWAIRSCRKPDGFSDQPPAAGGATRAEKRSRWPLRLTRYFSAAVTVRGPVVGLPRTTVAVATPTLPATSVALSTSLWVPNDSSPEPTQDRFSDVTFLPHTRLPSA